MIPQKVIVLLILALLLEEGTANQKKYVYDGPDGCTTKSCDCKVDVKVDERDEYGRPVSTVQHLTCQYAKDRRSALPESVKIFAKDMKSGFNEVLDEGKAFAKYSVKKGSDWYTIATEQARCAFNNAKYYAKRAGKKIDSFWNCLEKKTLRECILESTPAPAQGSTFKKEEFVEDEEEAQVEDEDEEVEVEENYAKHPKTLAEHILTSHRFAAVCLVLIVCYVVVKLGMLGLMNSQA